MPLRSTPPQLTDFPQSNAHYRQFADALREDGFEGDIQLDFASRIVQSTDNSIYQRLPQGVLYPRNTEDLERISRLSQRSEFIGLHFCPRGGGTGTNGQALGEGWVVDLSRHMNQILEINAEQGWARVQAGVVKDQLNAAVKAHGLFFAPDLSTSNRATIGGMINTDASGQGSCRYGKTRDHVLSLKTVLADGCVWESVPLDETEFQAVSKRGDRIGEVHRLLDSISREYADLIQEVFPPLNRSLTGYDLAHLRRGDRFDLNSILCGSEGTLGFVAEAVVNLERLPQHSALIVIQYDDFVAALRDGRVLMEAKPLAVETIDNVVVDLARGDAIWPQVAKFFPIADSFAGANFIELTADSQPSLQSTLDSLLVSLRDGGNAQRLGIVGTTDRAEINTLWTMRKRAVGLLGNMPGRERPVPFVEDTAVPPEHLADYIAEFRELLDAAGLRYGMFGHADAGVIHVRPALDMRESGSITTVRRISDQVFALTQRYGGLIWGEHGKGLRSEYGPKTFGKLYPQLQRIKAAFDPQNRLNPGKIATPDGSIDLLRIDAVPTRGDRDRLIPAALWDQYPDVVYCNGNAACFNWDPDQGMCPSYKGTRERKYSPKGRAALMKEWLAQSSRTGALPQREGWKNATFNYWQKISATLRKWRDGSDFSHQVFDSMDTCLACKSCTTGCPVQVDVPAFRSVFFEHYFRGYLRPLRHHLIASLEIMLPRIGRWPTAYNALMKSRVVSAGLDKAAGLTALPLMSETNFERELDALGIEVASPQRLRELSAAEKNVSVVIVQDVFTRFFDAELVLDVCRLLRALGFRVWFAPFLRNGKPLHVLGFLKAFHNTASSTSRQLRALAEGGMDLVGIDPSMTLTYRDEYAKAGLPGDAPPVLLLQEWLATKAGELTKRAQLFESGSFQLLPHCSESALAGASLAQWQMVFGQLGSDLSIKRVGCCGMAGTYGHESTHAETSRRIYELSWQQAVERRASEESEGGLCATGFSCRCQVQRFSGRQLPHPVQILLRQLRRPEG
ncbi:FAD-binding oxidoreductase [Proteobacteria bacterium 005FR1]|nr:FAD-binding oxidoreductase [Proteobacteria bacterium 005FR1]